MNAHEVFTSPVVERLGWMLLHSVWQLALIAVAIGLAMRFSRLSPRVRYGIACLGMVVMVVCPVATFFLIEMPESHEPLAAAESPAPRGVPAMESTSEVPLPPSADVEVTAEAITAGRPVPLSTNTAGITPEPPTLRARLAALTPWFVPPWLAGMFLLAVWQLGGYYCTRRWIVASKPIEAEFLTDRLTRLAERMDVKRTVRFLQSTRVATPLVLGWIRPAILLPVELITNLPAEHWDAVLAHELAHIRRYDYLVNLLQTAAETVLFYHPGVWVVSRWIRVERELCCDDIAAGVCGSPIQYAEALTRLETYRHAFAGAGAHPAVAAVNGGSTVNRVRRLLGVSPKPKHGRLAGVFAAAFVLVAVVAFTGVNADDNRLDRSKHDVETEEPVDPEAVVYFKGTVLDEGKPVPGAKVRLFHDADGWSEPVLADEKGRFRIKAGKGTESAFGWALLGESADVAKSLLKSMEMDVRALSFRSHVTIQLKDLTSIPVTLSLQPSKEVTVAVRGDDGKPVPGAAIRAIFGPVGYFNSLEYISTTADDDGRAVLRIPGGSRVAYVVARNQGMGVDYFENYEEGSWKPNETLPNRITLTLTKPVVVRLKMLDDRANPIENLTVHVRSFRGYGKRDSVHFRESPWFEATTDEKGVAVFHGLPRCERRSDGMIVFGYHDDRVGNGSFALRRYPLFWSTTTCTLRAVPITGKVVFPDGRPACGIEVGAQGEGLDREMSLFYGDITDADGTYRLLVPPRAVYMVGVCDREWTAGPRSGIVAIAGEDQTGHDFQLTRGTLIHGRADYEAKSKSGEETEAAHSVALSWTVLGRPVTVKRDGCDVEVTPWFFQGFGVQTGEPFSFRVAPGKVRVSARIDMSSRETVLNVTDQPEIACDFEFERPKNFELKIAAGVGGQLSRPVPNARASLLLLSDKEHCLTDDSAKMRFDEKGEMVVRGTCASSEDPAAGRPFADDKLLLIVRGSEEGRDLAGFAVVQPATQTVRVAMKPAATLRGRLVSADKTPVPQAYLYYLAKPPESGNSHSYQFSTTTGPDGVFEIDRLPVGVAVTVRTNSMLAYKDTSVVLKQRMVDRSGVIELGDLQVGDEASVVRIQSGKDLSGVPAD